MTFADDVVIDALSHARESCGPDPDSSREICGVVIVERGRQKYIRCRNIAVSSQDHFIIESKDYADAEDRGEVVGIVHSHPYFSPNPSQADLVMCERSGLPWLIVNVPVGTTAQCYPSGYQAPLVGRQFSHGVLDCYTLLRDYYERELKIVLPDFHRDDEWWSRGENLYLHNFEAAGFTRIDSASMREHDVILLQIAAPVPNHAAIYLGNNVILHHLMRRLSSRDVYGGWYRKITTHVLRHINLI